MRRTGVARIPLHYGRAPRYLVARMQKLAKEIVSIIVDEYGTDTFLRRMSDPFWFQALGCVLGYDWHSSGVTTVLTAVLKQTLVPGEHCLAICGGKGRFSRQTPAEIGNVGEEFGFSTGCVEALRYASKMSAKVDNAAIQAGYQLYHHAFVVAEDRKWAVIQQGMCAEDRTARRYHWLSDNVNEFVVEPQTAIVGEVEREVVLDMTARDSEGCRKTCVDIAKERPERTMRAITSIRPYFQKPLDSWFSKPEEITQKSQAIDVLSMPTTINWKTMKKIYEFQPTNYEELLGLKGVGPATVRALALIADMIYGEKPSWKDPVKYTFAYGGKDGVPHPIDREAMDESIQILRQAVEASKLGDKERLQSIGRLRKLVPSAIDK